MRPGRPPKSAIPREVIVGPWQDVDEGVCQRCKTERRLYSPLSQAGLKVCAPCAEPASISTIPRDTEIFEEEE